MIEPTIKTDQYELYLADCLDVLPQLSGIDAVVTDPPYGMMYVSGHRQQTHCEIRGDDKPHLLREACKIRANVARYVFCRWDNLQHIPKPRSLIHWVKNNWGMGDLSHEHARQTEQIAFYPCEGHSWGKARPTDVVFADRAKSDIHPTEKPVELLRKVLQWVPDGLTVLDPFMGSGTTGVAAIELGHRFIGIEIDKGYFEIAHKRIKHAASQRRMF